MNMTPYICHRNLPTGIAEAIALKATDATDAMRRAEALNPAVSKDWNAEETSYTFADASVLSVSGSDWCALNP
jgi:hypothetical protein